MDKQILIVKGSPRKKDRDCLGCGTCQRSDGKCVQKDDMTEIYTEMKKADAIVFASPVYFYTWTSLMKRMIDSFKQYVSCFRAGGNEIGGILFAYGTNGGDDEKCK